jgi:hypothetical protein
VLTRLCSRPVFGAAFEQLSLNAVDFSEVDATLMGQLLLQNFCLGCIDLGGSKPLPKEIKVLSDAFVRCRFPLRELSVSGRMLGLEGSASLLDALKECPLELLDLTANEICGVKATGTDPFNPFVLKMVCAPTAHRVPALRSAFVHSSHCGVCTVCGAGLRARAPSRARAAQAAPQGQQFNRQRRASLVLDPSPSALRCGWLLAAGWSAAHPEADGSRRAFAGVHERGGAARRRGAAL